MSIYKNNYTKFLYFKIPNGELRIERYPFNSGLRVSKIIRCERIIDIHCYRITDAIQTIRILLRGVRP